MSELEEAEEEDCVVTAEGAGGVGAAAPEATELSAGPINTFVHCDVPVLVTVLAQLSESHKRAYAVRLSSPEPNLLNELRLQAESVVESRHQAL